jgi:CRP-like cAMP-binding protein
MLTIVKTRLSDFQVPKERPILTLQFFQNIPFEAAQEMEKHMIERSYEKRESIFLEDDQADFVWFVKEGHVKEMNHLAEGRTQTLCMVGPQGMFGVSAFAGGEYGFQCVAETSVTVVSFPIQAFRNLMGKYPDLARAVVSQISKLLRQSKDRQSYSQESAEKRLLHVLIEMVEKFGTTIPLRRRQFAAMAGTSVETCIRAFSRLKEAGLMTSVNGRITVKNAKSLNERMNEL